MVTELSQEAVAAAKDRTKPPYLRRVCIRGYKSIAFCDVALQPLTILVGRNASGKSNFIDALAFLRDVMEYGAATAVKLRQGWQTIRCRTAVENQILIEVELAFWSVPLDDRPELQEWMTRPAIASTHEDSKEKGRWLSATYGLTLTPSRQGPPVVSEEHCALKPAARDEFYFTVSNGKLTQGWRGIATGTDVEPLIPDQPAYYDRERSTFLGTMDGLPFRDIAALLRSMGFYNFHTDACRTLQKPDPGWLLEKDGRNLASVIATTRANAAEAVERMGRYLAVITESVELLGVAKYGDYETVRFRVARHGQGPPLDFDAAGMSDGTLRTLAALVAAFQVVLPHGSPSLVAIEEPETSLHPAAMRALVDALDEATARTQILLTTHSAELLDNPTIRPENVRVVEMIDGQTVITPVDDASVDIVRRQLNTLGGLERDDLLELNADDLDRQQRLGQAEEGRPA